MMLLLLNMGLVTTHTWCCRYNLRHQGVNRLANSPPKTIGPPLHLPPSWRSMKLLFATRDSIVVISVKHTKPSEYGLMHLDVSIHCPHFTEARLFLSCRASGRYCSSLRVCWRSCVGGHTIRVSGTGELGQLSTK